MARKIAASGKGRTSSAGGWTVSKNPQFKSKKAVEAVHEYKDRVIKWNKKSAEAKRQVGRVPHAKP